MMGLVDKLRTRTSYRCPHTYIGKAHQSAAVVAQVGQVSQGHFCFCLNEHQCNNGHAARRACAGPK